MSLIAEMREKSDEFVQIRHDIHQHPEIGFTEFRTSNLVAENLQRWGYKVTRDLGGTGVVGQLKRGDGGKRLGIRADMDALPIRELTNLPYASRIEGLMHACGHDGHTAMLLAAAEHLATDGGFNGTLNLIFQPAEEGFGGAKKMIEDGLFQQFPCDAVFAMHNMPGLGLGKFSLRAGAALAACDPINVTLHGVGGHGAMPHLTSDPVVAGASIVMALQSIISRNVPPLKMGIITVGSFQAGHASNVISDTAVLQLSVRSLDRDVQDMLRRRIVELVEAQAKSYGLTASFKHLLGYPVTVNSLAETEFATAVATELVGDDNVILDMPPMTGSEDFSYMLEKVPGSFVLIGNGDKESGGPGACSLHNPAYDFDDNNITYGGAYWVKLARQFLQARPERSHGLSAATG